MMTKLMENLFKGGVMAALFAAAMPDAAMAAATAATDLKTSVNQLGSGMTNMPIVLSGIAYLAAGATMIHGCGLLKKHADNPTSQPLMAGVSRLMAGGVVASLPFGINWAINTFNWGGSSTENAPFISLPMNSGNFNIPTM